MSALTFRPFVRDDLRLLHTWLQRPHVRQWWTEEDTYEEVVEHYLPSITGEDPTELYLVLLDGKPIGFIQTYLVAHYPEYAQLVRGGEGDAGVDLLIGEVELTGSGLGSELLRRFVEEVVFARPETTGCIADPDVRNRASIRAFEKAGFRFAREAFDPDDGQMHALMRRDRKGDDSSALPAQP